MFLSNETTKKLLTHLKINMLHIIPWRFVSEDHLPFFSWVICRFHVNLPGCTFQDTMKSRQKRLVFFDKNVPSASQAPEFPSWKFFPPISLGFDIPRIESSQVPTCAFSSHVPRNFFQFKLLVKIVKVGHVGRIGYQQNKNTYVTPPNKSRMIYFVT